MVIEGLGPKVLAQREQVFEVFTDTLDSAFIAAQNVHNDGYLNLGIRDTTIGDIIQDTETNACYMILEKGYQSVPKDVLSFIDWGYKMNQFICIKQLCNI